MSSDVIHFQCNACQAPLTVPIALGGVTGPCPKCGQIITSPQAATALPNPAYAAPQVTPTAPPQTGQMAEGLQSIRQTLERTQDAPTSAAGAWEPPSLHQPATPISPLPTSSANLVFPSQMGGIPSAPPVSTSPQLGQPTALPPRRPPSQPPNASLLDGLLGDPTPPTTPANAWEAAPRQTLSPSAAGGPNHPTGIGSLSLGERLAETHTPPQVETGIDPLRQIPARNAAKPSLGDPSNKAKVGPFPRKPRRGFNMLRLAFAGLLLLAGAGVLGYFVFRDPLISLYHQHVVPRMDQATLDRVNGWLGLVVPPEPDIEDPKVADPLRDSNPLGTSIEPDEDSSPISPSDSTIPTPDPSTNPPTPEPPVSEPENPDQTLIEVRPPSSVSGGNGLTGSANKGSPETLLETVPAEARPAATALLEFLAADGIAEKSRYILAAEDPEIASLIQRYYAIESPAPIPVSNVGFIRHDPNPEVGGGTQSVFMVASPNWTYPIPVMIQQTSKGCRLDWIAFTEFKDDWLLKFVENFRPNPGRFHVSIKRSHYFQKDVPDLEQKDCYILQPPQEHFSVSVFVPKDTPLAEKLRREVSWSTQFAYVLAEIQWRESGPLKWIELTAVPQMNWHITTEPDVPKALVPESSSAAP